MLKRNDMKAPDIIYTDGENTCAPAPVFSNIDGNVKYIRADLAEQPETDLLEESYMRGFAQGAKEERERMLEDIAKLSDTAEKRGLNFGAECGFQIALDELEQRLTGKH